MSSTGIAHAGSGMTGFCAVSCWQRAFISSFFLSEGNAVFSLYFKFNGDMLL